MKKRFLGILLALCMILTLVPATVFAADTAVNVTDAAELAAADTAVTVTDAAELAAAVAAGGTVKLGDDIDITSTLEINGKVTLDLNGRVLKMTGSGSVIAITGSGDLTLTDGDSAATHTDTSLPVGGVITGGVASEGGGVYNDGTFTMKSGTIFGCEVSYFGGGLYNNDTFNMEGGTISNCWASYSSGGVCNAGTFTMKGGMISDCGAALSSGGVNNADTFTMEGGSISNCKADLGGGVCNAGNFTMEGGTISNCTANNSRGGGVYNSVGNFTMEGGTISGCTASSSGGGVYNLQGQFTMEGGTISGCTATPGGGVYNEMNGTLKNTSTTGGATICYDELVNDGSIEGKLVKFYNGDDLYAWEIVPENAKAVKPADPQKSGYVLEGWYKENTFDNKWDFDNDTVSADMQLYANWDPIITLTVPFTTTVALGDVGKPGETVFDLAIVQTSMPEEYDTRVTVSGTLTTNGDGSYDGILTLTGPSEELRAMLCEGAIVQQVNGGEANWTYDDTVWGLLLYNGAMYADLNDDQEQAPAMQINIYPATCENTDDGPYYKLDREAVYACQTVDKMTFTNTYTAHEYALNHDADGHWDECACGDVQNKEAHKFGEWKVTKDATASAKGEKERVCSVCDYVETAEIPMPEENEPPKTDVPQTGDDRNMALWFTLLFVSGGALIGTAVYDKKRKYSAK